MSAQVLAFVNIGAPTYEIRNDSMKKIGFLLIAIPTATLFTACGRAPAPSPAQGDESTTPAKVEENNGMEPVTLHARIDYSGSSATKEIGKTGTTLSFEIREPAFREGKGKSARYSQDTSGQTQVQGFIHGAGHADISSNDGHIEENYDKKGEWNSLQAPQKGNFSIMPPEPSDIGDGLQVEIELHAPVTGEQWMKALGQQSPDVTFARPLECTEKDEYLDDHGPACGVKFHIDPTPTGPKTEAGKMLYDKIVEALKQTNGEWVMAMLGQLYGAETTYENNEFVLQVHKQSTFDKDGVTMHRNIDITVWSSRRDSDWAPKSVTPVKMQ
jgi:hypothetical protein